MACSGMDSIEEQIKDMTDCPICLDACKDPKILPCIHTFCMNCLLETGRKLNKNPKDMMPCPVCRSEFEIPETGFGGLKKNFFMERLTEMRQVLKPSSSISLCDPCLEERESNAEADVPPAEMYCVDCHQKLCQECYKYHKKNKLTKHHKIIPVDAAQQVITTDEAFITDKCEKHAGKPFEIYCSKCEEVVCSLCFIEQHNGHTCSDMNKVASDIKMDIQKSVEYWSSYLPELDQKKQELDEHDANVICKVEEVQSKICIRREELKELIDQHAGSILQELDMLKQLQLKKSYAFKDNIETLLASLQGYKSYCLQLTQLGSAIDLCKAKNVLETAAKELQQRQALVDETSLKPFEVLFKVTDLQEYKMKQDFNIVGHLIDSDDGISQGRVSYAQTDGVDAKLMDIQIFLDQSSQLLEDWKSKPVKELDQKFDDVVIEQNMHVEEALKKLPIPLISETEDFAMDRDKLVESMSTTIKSLNCELDIERKRVQELEEERDLLSALTKDYASNEQSTKDKVKDLSEQLALLKGLLYDGEETKTAKGTINWEGELTLSTTLETFPDTYIKNYKVFGVAILGNEVFVASSENTVVVHDGTTLKFKRRWKLPRTGEIVDDMTQCNANKCLYLVKLDSKTCNKIIRLDLRGNEIVTWSIKAARGKISVTSDSNVLLTASILNQLQEYSPDGKLLQVVHLPWDSGIENPEHAIKLISDHFLVCHGNEFSPLRRVCLVDITGDVIKSFSEPMDSGLLYSPMYMYIDIAGEVLVLDQYKSRVLLLSRNLEFRRHLSTPRGPEFSTNLKMCIDESNRRVFIVEGGMINKVHVYLKQ